MLASFRMQETKKITELTPEVRSDKSLTLLDQWTNGLRDGWTNGPIDQWTNGLINQ